jgi:hypothetical protein
LSLCAVKIVEKYRDRPIKAFQSSYHAISSPGTDNAWSQDELSMQYDSLHSLPDELRHSVHPESYLGAQIKHILKASSFDKLPGLAKRAFPAADSLVDRSYGAFDSGNVTIELVSMTHMRREDSSMRAISFAGESPVRILVGCELSDGPEQQIGLPNIYK